MGNAFGVGPNNEAPHGRDVTAEGRKSERSHSGAPNVGPEVKSLEEENLLRRQFVEVYLERSHSRMREERQA